MSDFNSLIGSASSLSHLSHLTCVLMNQILHAGGLLYCQRKTWHTLNPYPAKLIYFNFQALEVVSRYRDSQPQMLEKYSYLYNLRPNICKS